MSDLKDFEVLFTEEQIQNKIQELADKINKDYEGKELILICILKGAVYFAVDLSKKNK